MGYEKISVLEGFRSDIKQLPDNCKRMAIQILVDVKDGVLSGEPLGTSLATGDLSDCFKVYFDPDPDFVGRGDWRFRLVYRVLSDGAVEGVVVEGVSVGRRQNLDAYLRAIENLRR
ncbi:hypothetical protein [Arthrobacter sp. TB 26]|uniref:hypothetical protein n=1 Tax=Arthrobacter sp. TB 26 TaxID=494420 RepID=UPI000462D352|nr:hypothetical protein [Arthrobacter sp. TB 26]